MDEKKLIKSEVTAIYIVQKPKKLLQFLCIVKTSKFEHWWQSLDRLDSQKKI
jgi:hypothetical protein